VEGARNGNGGALSSLLSNPVFANVVRVFIFVVLALGGYIWKAEIDHVNAALLDLRQQVQVSLNRQWDETREVRQDVTQVQQQLQQVLLRNNEALLKLLEPRTARR
jgi:hypothetical protein